MFINPNIILNAFSELSNIDPDGDGKKARERLSALRYFLATAELLTTRQTDSILLSTDDMPARDDFTTAVGNVVRLDEDGGYTNNFSEEQERNKSYKAGNNFITTALKKDGPYPGRPAPLIIRENESVSLSPEYADNIKAFGAWPEYKLPLAIWLLRFFEFEEEVGEDSNTLAQNGCQRLIDRYGDVANILFESPDDISVFIARLAEEHQWPLLVNDKPDYYSLLSSYLAKPTSTKATVGENIMFYGAPGTGKSYRLKKFEPSVRTVFHGDYQNTDFVGSYRPFMDKGNVTYTFSPGPFVNSFVSALKDQEEQHYLIIEEINRANAGAVFGEVFQLLDRDDSGKSEYEIFPEMALKSYLDQTLKEVAEWQGMLYMPSNLTILATMNSADQGVEPLDSAFKRRWKFNYLPINFERIGSSDIRRASLIPYAGRNYSWCEFAEACNALLLNVGVEEDRLLGPYFLSNSDFSDQGDMDKVMFGKVFIYLWDDVLRHGLRDVLFKVEDSRSFYELSKRYRDSERIFSRQFEDALGYEPLTEEEIQA